MRLNRVLTVALIGLAMLLPGLLSAAQPPKAKPDVTAPPAASSTPQAVIPDRRGTIDQPLIVQSIDPPGTAEKAAADLKDRAAQRDAEYTRQTRSDYYTWAQIVAAILSAGAAIGQVVLLRATIRYTKAAAEAARDAAEGPIMAERAFAFVESIGTMSPHGTPILLLSEGETVFALNCRVINYGRTPAIILSAAFGIKRLPAGAVDASETVDQELRHPLVIGANLHHDFEFHTAMTHDEWLAIRQDKEVLYCFGLIKYQDVYQKARSTWFFRKWDHRTDKFTPTGSPLQNFWD